MGKIGQKKLNLKIAVLERQYTNLPTLSIITVARNCERLLQKCYKNISEQDYPKDKIEMLLIDGGSIDRTKEMADSYGRNFLTPKKLAVLSDAKAIRALERQHRTDSHIEGEQTELAHQIEGKEIILKARTGAQEKLFGSITAADIAEELQSTTGIAIDKRKIELEEPIRHLGSYEVEVKLAKDITAKITVIVAEKEKAQSGE